MPDANTPATVPPAPTFTPGPWRADRRAILTNDLRCIAVVYSGAYDSLEEANATEALIAAAPDLLEALKTIIEDRPRDVVAAIQAAEAAIAKAEGRL